MEMNFEYRGIGDTVRILLTAVATVLISAPVSAGPIKDEAITVCTETLTANYGANGFSDTRANRVNTQRYFVYATARLADGETIPFRCHVHQGTVRTVKVFASANPVILGSQSRWTSAEPYRVKPEPDADVPAETTPEQEPKQSEAPVEIDPGFKTPGTGTGFKTPGTGTGFKTPGTETGFKTPDTESGSLFKPAK